MLFQSNNLFPHLTIFRNVALAMTSRRWLTKAQQQQVGDALDRVGLSGFENRKPGELSGGQQSRAALARVLLQKKPILLLDEPFAALGPAMRNEMLDLVKEIAQTDNQIVLLVTHSPDDALRICDQTIFVSNKRLWLAGDTKIALQNVPSEMQDYFG
jgi:thiamine transport system ATP-binding protein